ncbi:J domain-containing protein [Arthrobacter sp. NPDC080086]|uniref:J domain-containing protein n=1 Tax=Arthrobacter sp. NPDC080086 TaxID=3155917 RepID=UPI00344E3E51
MPRRLYMPNEVLQSIKEHIDIAIPQAVAGFMSANEDEDTMTGQLGAYLRTGVHTVQVKQAEIDGAWKWSIDYTKFRGRGKDATESFIGADGIIELSVDWTGRKETKALLFQAKMDWQSDSSLVQQAMLLSTWREASIFVNYTETAFEALSIDSVLRSRGVRSDAKGLIPLADALSEYFLQCKVGSTDLAYDPVARQLRWRAMTGVTVATQFSIPHRLRVKVKAPGYKHKLEWDKLIPKSEIHSHRMAVEPDELIAPLLTSVAVEPKKQFQALSSAYHPDKLGQMDQLVKDLANRRMQEINAAYADIKEKGKTGSS